KECIQGGIQPWDVRLVSGDAGDKMFLMAVVDMILPLIIVVDTVVVEITGRENSLFVTTVAVVVVVVTIMVKVIIMQNISLLVIAVVAVDVTLVVKLVIFHQRLP
nr:hypothetical protein [Tanacetum cinerariifolium]